VKKVENKNIVPGKIVKAAQLKRNEVTDKDLELINKYTLRDLTADEVFTFKVRMADNSLDDRNYQPFSKNALIQLKDLYIGRTVGRDHSCKSDDQCARVYDTDLVESDKNNGVNGEKVYDLVAKCYTVKTDNNKALISEIEAGIKREVSTSCSCKSVICSICGTDNVKDYCRHWAGREYDTDNGKKKCLMVLDSIKEAYELSFVSVPAQPQAGTYKAYGDTVLEYTPESAEEDKAKQLEAKVRTAIAIAEKTINMHEMEDN
jgi:hypothetical protein